MDSERPSTPQPNDTEQTESQHVDPRLRTPEGDRGIPAEFVDTPPNEPGSQEPPDPADVDGS